MIANVEKFCNCVWFGIDLDRAKKLIPNSFYKTTGGEEMNSNFNVTMTETSETPFVINSSSLGTL